MVPARLDGGTGHGTKMATIAAGKIHGIAPNADLYLLKAKGLWKTGGPGDDKKDRSFPDSCYEDDLDSNPLSYRGQTRCQRGR